MNIDSHPTTVKAVGQGCGPCYITAHGTALGTVTMLVRRIAMYGPDYFTIAAYFPLKNN
jgi:hypothetical protein